MREHIADFCTVIISGKWRVESGKWRVESGKWRVESGEWKVESLGCTQITGDR
jgi:hypothetical protein